MGVIFSCQGCGEMGLGLKVSRVLETHVFPSAFRLQPIDFKAFGFEIFIVKWVFLSFNRKM